MATKHKTWVFTRKSLKEKPSEGTKTRHMKLADNFIQNELKPQYVKRPPKNNQFNYIVDIYTRWRQNSLFFCAKYRSPDGDVEFECKSARLERLKTGKFDLAYFRHTGKWWVTDGNLPINNALELIEKSGPFEP